MRQTLMTVVAKVKRGRADILKTTLDPRAYENQLKDMKNLHFSSMSLANVSEETYFIWESNFDEDSTDDYLRRAVETAGGELKTAYEQCEGFEHTSDLYKYLKERIHSSAIYHIGAPALSVDRISKEDALVKNLQEFLDRSGLGSPSEIQQYLRDCVANDSSLRWAEAPDHRLGRWDLAWRRVSYWIVLLATILLLVVFLPFTAAAAVFLRRAERRDDVDANPPESLDALLQHEDNGVQNHLVSVIDVKPGRRKLLRVLLWLGSFAARVQTKGTLGGIPGIFFAHWSLIDDGRKLLFVTNYSGGWDSYLDDFIDLASWQLTPVWTNTKGFPKTRLLFFGGSRDRAAFKRYVRRHQSETLVWYRAYPHLTVQNVNRNSAIRDGLFRTLSDEERSAWLKLL